MVRKKNTAKTFRLSDEGNDLLLAISDRLGISQTAVLELAIREKAERMNVTLPTPPQSSKQG